MIRTKLMILVSFWHFAGLADYVEQTARTNVNKQSDLFKRSIGNVNSLENDLGYGNNEVLNNLRVNGNNLDFLKEKTANNRDQISSLKNTRFRDLHSKGEEELYRKSVIDEIYLDYTRPLNISHKKDALNIAESSGKLLNRLTLLLKNLGVDCKTVRGNKIIEPGYHIQLKRRQSKNTIYNKKICQELRDKYHCLDELIMKCQKKGMKWTKFENRRVRIDGDTIYHQAYHLGYAIKWKKKRYGWHIRQDIQGWRKYLSEYLDIPIEQILSVSFPYGARGVGNITHPLYDRWRVVFNKYEFIYQYREGEPICLKWSKHWRERCRLQ